MFAAGHFYDYSGISNFMVESPRFFSLSFSLSFFLSFFFTYSLFLIFRPTIAFIFCRLQQSS